MKQAQNLRMVAHLSLLASLVSQVVHLVNDNFWVGSAAMFLLMLSLILHSWSAETFERELYWQKLQNKILYTTLENQAGLKVEIERQNQK